VAHGAGGWSGDASEPDIGLPAAPQPAGCHGFVHAHNSVNLALAMIGFDQGINLVKLELGELRIVFYQCLLFF